MAQPRGGEWKHGLFGCCENCKDICDLMCCPCCYMHEIAKKSNCSPAVCACLCPGYSICCVRKAVREDRGIEGGCLEDFFIGYCLGCCAAIQMGKEYK